MGTKWKGPKRERRALDAYIALFRAGETLASVRGRELAAHTLSPTQIGVLDALYHLGDLSFAEIGAKMLRSPGNMTTAVDRLEERDLVRRQRDSKDRRVVRVCLTRKGTSFVERVMPDHVRTITETMSVLSASEQEALALLCRKLGLAIQKLRRTS